MTEFTGKVNLPPKWSEPLSTTGKEPPLIKSPAQEARHKARTTLSWRGDEGVHVQAILEAAVAAGEEIYNGEDYVGLTYNRMVEIFKELGEHRKDREQLRDWMLENLTLREDDKAGNPVLVVIRVMSDVKTILSSCWPHVLTLWGNVAHVLKNAGVLPPDKV